MAADVTIAEFPRSAVTPEQWEALVRALDAWGDALKAQVANLPADAYKLGYEQTLTFAQLVGQATGLDSPFAGGAMTPTQERAVYWLRQGLMHELDGRIAAYKDSIQNTLLYGLQNAENPTAVASQLYRLLYDGDYNWRAIARTEMSRASALGRLDASYAQGYDKVWCPPHVLACSSCRRLLENQVFDIADVRDASNIGRKQKDWVAAIPLHPNCRHVWLPYDPVVYAEAQEQYQQLHDIGMDDESNLERLFDTSGQVRPGMEAEAARVIGALKTRHAAVLSDAVEKARSSHHSTVRKGYFDNPQAGLDPLLWEGQELRGEVADRIDAFMADTLGDDYERFAHLFLTGGAVTLQWAAIHEPEPDPDLDVQIVLDYPALRAARPAWAAMTDPELHLAIVMAVRLHLQDAPEVAPGVRLDAFCRGEQTADEFRADVTRVGAPVYDLTDGTWVVAVRPADTAELWGAPYMEGMGAHVATEHPDWLVEAHAVVDALNDALRQGDLDGLRNLYHALHTDRQESYTLPDGPETKGNFVWQYAVAYGPLMHVKAVLGKVSLNDLWPGMTLSGQDVWKAKVEAGREHWITVHPNGPDTKGRPVLVRDMKDGSMMVIGGAGGSGTLNFLRLQPRPKTAPKAEAQPGAADDESLRQITGAEWHRAHDRAAAATGKIADVRSEIDAYMAEQVGVDLQHLQVREHGERVERAATAGERRFVQRAMYRAALAVASGADGLQRDMDDSPTGTPFLAVTERARAESERSKDAPDLDDESGSDESAGEVTPDEKKPDEKKPDAEPDGTLDVDDNPADDGTSGVSDTRTARQMGVRRALRFRVPDLSSEQAQHLIELNQQVERWGRVRAGARRVLAGAAKPQDALALNWSDDDVAGGAKAAAARRIAAEQRTTVNRELLNELESSPAQSRIAQRMVQGAFDTVDAFTNACLDWSPMDPRVVSGLGVQAAAQIAVYAVQNSPARSGKMVPTQKALAALNQLTDQNELDAATRGLARARKAADMAVNMRKELRLSAQGRSLWTKTFTRSAGMKAMNDSAQALGMSVAGMEAASALKVALQGEPVREVRIPGFVTRGAAREAASRAGLNLTDREVRASGGSYAIVLGRSRLAQLTSAKAMGAPAERRMRDIRMLPDDSPEVIAAQTVPGMSTTLAPGQARGRKFLVEADEGAVLAFAPGVGKTHTALAALLDMRRLEPEANHRAVVIAPLTARKQWADTTTGFTKLSVATPNGFRGLRNAAEHPADVTVMSYELARANPELVRQLGADIVIADEAQKLKNSGRQAWRSLGKIRQGAAKTWLLTGTPIEKNVSDLRAQLQIAAPKSVEAGFDDKYRDLNRGVHLMSDDRIRQFRAPLSGNLYVMAAGAAKNHLPPKNVGSDDPDMPQRVDVTLDDAQTNELQAAVKRINAEQDQRRAAGEPGIPFGGQNELRQLLLNREGGALATKAADLVASTPDRTVDGKVYAGKSVVFAQQVKSCDVVADAVKASKSGVKVFVAHGSMTNDQNDQALKDFLAYNGRATLITTDKNSTARNFQLGRTENRFQHGAVRMIHYGLPDNNATIQQREARIYRRGAAAETDSFYLTANTPAEQMQAKRLSDERLTQQTVGNREDTVPKHQTLRALLEERGVDVEGDGRARK